MDTVSFRCEKCGHDFEFEWDFGYIVVCSNCLTLWETDYETDSDDNIQGPWLTKPVEDDKSGG